MESAILLIAISSLLILSSVEATQPVISPAKAPQSDLIAMINNNLNKIKLNAERAVEAFDKVANDGSPKSEAQAAWLKLCRMEYSTMITDVTNYAKPDLEEGSGSLQIDLEAFLKGLESCDHSISELEGGLENPAKIYENSIKELTHEAMTLYENSIKELTHEAMNLYETATSYIH